MTTFGSSFSTYTRPADGIFGPILDTVSDWGWSLLPQFPGSPWPVAGSVPGANPQSVPVPVVPQIPVEVANEGWVIEGSPAVVYPVLPGPQPARRVEVPREIVIVEGLPTEVERHPEGDFPAGSIFAPGATWGVEPHDLDTAPTIDEEEPVGIWTEIFNAGVDIIQGQQPGGIPFNALGPVFAAGTDVARPSGRAALPASAAPIQMTPSQDCGNRRYVTLDRQTGKITCKRRRRRRLLTNRDLADLASLKTITGGGAALNAAVIRAVR